MTTTGMKLRRDGYRFVWLTLCGIRRKGFRKKTDTDEYEFIEHGSGDSYELPMTITRKPNQNGFEKKY